jgi:hypothetical protein
MARIELTIDTNYRPTWGTWEGVRELVQNARDSEIQNGAKMTVDYVNGTLRIENEGAALTRENLLLGQTSKADDHRTAGHFGEGMKIGILALLRQGLTVRIRTGSEVWTPSIVRSEKFSADVLAFEIIGGREDKRRVRIEVGGGQFPSDTWEEMKEKFLFLGRTTKNDRVQTDRGTLLIAPRFQGKVFVKGIFVSHKPELLYGYDFVDVATDIDRKMIDSYDLEAATRRLLCDAVAAQPTLLAGVVDSILDGSDKLGVDSWSAYQLGASITDAVVASFHAVHGPDAVAVSNTGESQAVAALGKRGIVVAGSALAIVQKTVGTVDQLKAKLKDEVVRTYGWHELTTSEQDALVTGLAYAGREDQMENISVVAFRDQGIVGLSGSPVKIARKALDSAEHALEVLIHEFAHNDTGAPDCDVRHVKAIEAGWRAAFTRLAARKL